ncbi:MAG: MG2 domain-containing protein [Planctomycetaceae bacterium]
MLKPDEHVLDRVDDYLNGLLAARDAKTLERHAESCPICRVALGEARKRADVMTALPPMEASNDLLQCVEQRIDDDVRKPRVVKAARWVRELSTAKKGLMAAAVAAVVIGSINIYYATLKPTPYDLRVLGQTELLAGAPASLRVFLFDRSRGIPLANVPVTLELVDRGTRPPVLLAEFRTDARGTASPRFRLPEWDDGDYQLRVVAHPDGATEEITRTVALRRRWRLMLSTDKPVYQPGQTIRLRSLAMRRPDLKPVAGREVNFSVTDPKGNVIFRRRGVTSNFGIASADCPLADEILHGSYRIECRVGDTTSAAAVDVRKYVLPKFKLNVELDKPFYQPGDVVRGTVTAAYFFGKPVAKGTVRVEPITTDVGPAKLPVVNATTNAKGVAEFSFRIPENLVGRPQRQSDASLRIGVTVTDSAGQKHDRHLSRVVTNQAIRVEVIPESGRLVLGVPNVVYLLTTYPDGRPAKTRVAVTGFDKEFQTDALGVTTVNITPVLPDSETEVGPRAAVHWNLKATDVQGRVGRRQVALQPGVAIGDFLLRTDKAVYTSGETMKLTVHGGGVEPVFVDLLKDGQTVLTESVPVTGGRGEYQFDIPADLFGTLQVHAYRFDRQGVAVRKTRVIHVRQARQLQITTVLDRREYRPGRKATLKFRLRDAAGQPVPGAISLAAVDAAVYSVRRRRPGLEQTFFTLEQELLQPVYAVYPWSPGTPLPGDARQRDRFERALFARTAVDGQTQRQFPGVSQVSGISPHSLRVESFTSKFERVEQRRIAGIELAENLWVWFGVASGIAVYVGVWFFDKIVASVVTMIALFLLCAGLVIPSVQQAREAARRESGYFALGDAAKTKTTAARPERRLRRGLPAQGAEPSKHPAPNDDGEDRLQQPNAPRVRQWFPETLLWRPELITDDDGNARLEIDLADSITTWRVNASAVSTDGRLGAARTDVRVFQPFFVDLDLPVALMRGDEVGVPVVVYNYLDKPQTVRLSLKKADWFEPLDGETRSVELPAGGVRSTHIRLRVKKVGRHALQVTAKSGGIADAVSRSIVVVPDGRPVSRVVNGTLDRPAETEWTVPENAVEGSPKTILKIYPSSFSQLVEGLDGIFRRPYGCFEQTSSTTYPNVLALQYLKRTGKSVPAVEAKARQYIHLGYQRLLTFEVAGGGFDWFGRGPAKPVLTAYGLMEFEDMARVYDVDPKVIRRTRNWLLAQRRPDGSWDRHGRNDLIATAYIAWAVFRNDGRGGDPSSTRDFLLRHRPETIRDPYTLALVCNALTEIDSQDPAARPYLDRLLKLRQTGSDGKQTWWQNPQQGTLFYGGGPAGRIETTALATLALLATETEPEAIRKTLAWLLARRDGAGTWHSTQATILALQALTAGTGKTLGGDKPRRVDVAVDGKTVRRIVIPPDQADVMRQLDLSAHFAAGRHRLSLTDRGGNAPGFQIAFRYHVPGPPKNPAGDSGPLAIDLSFDTVDLRVKDVVTASVTVTNRRRTASPMVIVDLPIPPGFAAQREEFSRALQAGRIAKFQMTPRSVVLYLRRLGGEKLFRLSYRLRATMPVKTAARPAVVYEYYNPDAKAATAPTPLDVKTAVER